MILCISLSDGIQIFIGVATTIGILLAFNANRSQQKMLADQLKQNSDQLKLSFFADYTKRYQEICLHFPENINEETFDFNNLEKEIRDPTLRYMRAYFDLCSEEFHLHKRKSIDEEIWKEWEGGIKYAISKRAFQDAWKIIIVNTKYNIEFLNWIESEMPKATS